MRVHLLLSDKQRDEIPNSITVVQDFGDVTIVTNPEESQWARKYFRGPHILIEGSKEDIRDWLNNYESFYLGHGHPMEPKFEFWSKD